MLAEDHEAVTQEQHGSMTNYSGRVHLQQEAGLGSADWEVLTFSSAPNPVLGTPHGTAKSPSKLANELSKVPSRLSKRCVAFGDQDSMTLATMLKARMNLDESTEKGNSEICDPFSNNNSLDVHDSFISFDHDGLVLENINNVGISLGSSSDTCLKCGSIFESFRKG